MLLPLSDFPIIATTNTVIAPLGPDVLLVVTPHQANRLGVNYENRIPSNILKQFMRATINRADKGLIFAEEKYLLKCQKTIWWYKRRQNLGLF